MKWKFLTLVLTVAMFAFAFQSKAETVTINSSLIESIVLVPTNGIDPPITITSTHDVDAGIYTAYVQLSASAGSLIATGHIERSFSAWMVDPYPNVNLEYFIQDAYPDTDTSSPTYGQAYFYSVQVGDANNNVFDFVPF